MENTIIDEQEQYDDCYDEEQYHDSYNERDFPCEKVEETWEEGEYIEVLYNSCYGGFSLSEEAKEMYKAKTDVILYGYDSHVNRTNKILLEIYHEFKLKEKKFSGQCACIEIKKIHKKYKNCYIISEYDGLEDVMIDYDKFKLENIEKIVSHSTMPNDEKILALKSLFHSAI
jgi:hypothetical protein